MEEEDKGRVVGSLGALMMGGKTEEERRSGTERPEARKVV